MTRLTEFVLRHRLLVIVFWLAAGIVGVLTVSTTTSRMSQSFDQPGSAAVTTDTRIAQEYGSSANLDPDVVVVTLPAGQTVDSPGVKGQLVRLLDPVRSGGSRVVDFPSTGSRAFVTASGGTAYALVYQPGRTHHPLAVTALAGTTPTGTTPSGWHVGVTGTAALTEAPATGGGNGLLVETMLGGIGALLVLAFVFASFVSVLPIVVAGVSILSTFLIVLGMTGFVDINFIASFIIGLIGLGVAIDYSLLVVTRWREERARGLDNRDAVRVAMAHAGRAVAFSGVTVAIGLLALLALPIPALRSLGYAGAVIPLVSVAVTLTLLPVLLDLVGPRLDWPRFRLRHEGTPSRAWSAWGRLTVRRRWVAAGLGFVALGALAAPAMHLQLGEPRTSALAHTGVAREALTALTSTSSTSTSSTSTSSTSNGSTSNGPTTGVLTPLTVLVSPGASGTVAAAVQAVPGVYAAVPSGTDLVTVLPRDEAMSGAGGDTVARVRQALDGRADVVGIAGSGAAQADFQHAVYGTLPWMLLLVSVLTFLLLARAFRSLVLPLKAVLLNLISLGAAYGVLVLVWQDGHGSDAVWGTPATGAIATWVPLMVFAFLFGLSMDYEVFLLARMREAHDEGQDTDHAVVTGLSRTGRLVTAAALILSLAFLAMSTAPAVDVRVLATGLGAGILVDATIVRCLLVPALVSLLGRWNWWLPGWAARVLRVAESTVELAPEPAPAMASR